MKWSAGWRMPLFSNDVVSTFDTWGDARNHLTDELRNYANSFVDGHAKDLQRRLLNWAFVLDGLPDDFNTEIGRTLGEFHWWIKQAP